MKLMLIAILALLITACASNPASDFFDRLEFEEGQTGCIRVTGQVNVGSNPFAGGGLNVSLVKKQGESEDC